MVNRPQKRRPNKQAGSAPLVFLAIWANPPLIRESLPLTAADCASPTSSKNVRNQRKPKFGYQDTGGQTARIPGITRF